MKHRLKVKLFFFHNRFFSEISSVQARCSFDETAVRSSLKVQSFFAQNDKMQRKWREIIDFDKSFFLKNFSVSTVRYSVEPPNQAY